MDNFPRHVLIVAVLALVLGAGLATQAAGGTAHAPAVTHLVLNEVDYDNVGADNREFVEVFNGTGAPVVRSRFRFPGRTTRSRTGLRTAWR